MSQLEECSGTEARQMEARLAVSLLHGQRDNDLESVGVRTDVSSEKI